MKATCAPAINYLGPVAAGGFGLQTARIDSDSHQALLTCKYIVDEDFMPFSMCDRVSHTHENLCGWRFLKQYTSLLLIRS
jgi:hypothetical protein